MRIRSTMPTTGDAFLGVTVAGLVALMTALLVVAFL
jgi:hypothetical protein